MAVALAPVTYYFAGDLNDPFGSLAVGTPFSGSFSYFDTQPLNTPSVSYRGDYSYTNLSVTFGSTTVSDNGPGYLNIYDHGTYDTNFQPLGTYPTDIFSLNTSNVNGSLGGLTLNPGGLWVVAQDVTGNVFNSPAIPGPNLTLNDFTVGNATFLQLMSQFSAPFTQPTFARGDLTYLSSTPAPSLPLYPTFAPSISQMPLPSLVTSGSTAQLCTNNPACPPDVANWLSDTYNSLMISVGQNDFFYPQWLKQAAPAASTVLTAVTSVIGLVTSETLLDISEWAVGVAGIVNQSAADAAQALDSAAVADDLIAIAISAHDANPLLAAVDANTMIWGDLVAPQLAQYGNDPVDPDYNQFYQTPSAPLTFNLAPTCSAALDTAAASLLQSSYRAAEDLNGANHSFDRYTSAYNSGDAQSALFQMEAILYYVNLYKNEATLNASLTNTLRGSLCGDVTPSPFVDPALLASMQQELLTNGFPSELSPLFADLGLSQSDILGMQNKIISLTPNDFTGISLDQGLSQIEQAMNVPTSLPNNVPEPNSVLLLILGLAGLRIIRQRRF